MKNGREFSITGKSPERTGSFRKKKEKIMKHNMTELELLTIIKDVFEYSQLDDEDKEALDFFDELQNIQFDVDSLIYSLSQTLVTWHIYLRRYEKLEKFELCGLIRDVIQCEIIEYKRVLKMYLQQEADDDELRNLVRIIREEVNNNYKDYMI